MIKGYAKLIDHKHILCINFIWWHWWNNQIVPLCLLKYRRQLSLNVQDRMLRFHSWLFEIYSGNCWLKQKYILFIIICSPWFYNIKNVKYPQAVYEKILFEFFEKTNQRWGIKVSYAFNRIQPWGNRIKPWHWSSCNMVRFRWPTAFSICQGQYDVATWKGPKELKTLQFTEIKKTNIKTRKWNVKIQTL